MTVRVYYLDTELIDGVEKVKGEAVISNAILEIEGTQRKLTMDTTTAQHDALKKLAASSRLAYPQEQAALQACDFTPPPPNLQLQVDELKARITTLEAAK